MEKIINHINEEIHLFKIKIHIPRKETKEMKKEKETKATTTTKKATTKTTAEKKTKTTKAKAETKSTEKKTKTSSKAKVESKEEVVEKKPRATKAKAESKTSEKKTKAKAEPKSTEKKSKAEPKASKAKTTKTKTKVEEPVVDAKEPVVEENYDVNEFNSFYDPQKTKIDLDGLASLSKETKNSVVFLSKEQIRIIIDNYYATQRYRMNISNQIRAVAQGFDDCGEDEQPAVAWLLKDVQNRENQIKKMIEEYAKSVPVCRWAMDIKGIGPVFAANLWNYIDMDRCRHANHLISYAGQNDQNCPWLGVEKAREMVNEAYEYFGLKSSDPVTEDVFLRVAVNSGRTVEKVKRGFNIHREQATKATTDRTVLIKYMAKPPYNIELKKICYLIGESFVKVSNRNSLYGRIYKERKALETMRNENGEYREQAEKLLSEKNYSKDTETYKYLSQGKLSPAHINARAKRYAVKFFLTHFFEACWVYKYGTKPPSIYPIEHQGHVDYIGPEVPYDKYFTYK